MPGESRAHSSPYLKRCLHWKRLRLSHRSFRTSRSSSSRSRDGYLRTRGREMVGASSPTSSAPDVQHGDSSSTAVVTKS